MKTTITKTLRIQCGLSIINMAINKRVYTIGLLICLLFTTACKETHKISVEEITLQWYDVYQERSDFEHFLSFYDEEMVLEDFIFGVRVEGRENFKAFFDWPNPNFKKLEDKTLVVTETVIDKNRAVLIGYFTPFKWGEVTSEAMHFTTILEFNESGKIIKQQDWFNYSNSLVNYDTRKNSNEWLKSNTNLSEN